MSGIPIPKGVSALSEEPTMVSSSPDWNISAPGSLKANDLKGSWHGMKSALFSDLI